MTNDGVFIHEAIIPSTTKLQTERLNNHRENCVVHLQHEPINQNEPRTPTHLHKAYEKIFKDYQDPGTLLQFKT
jgi:hypothetical protein